MRMILFLFTFAMSYPVDELVAIPRHCPKIDHSMLKADANKFRVGGELKLNGYRWKVTGGNLCNPNCGNAYEQALQEDVNIESDYDILKGTATCHYSFIFKDETIADLVLITDDSMKLPQHSYERWSDVTNKVEEVMEKEEEQYRDDPRIRME